MLIIGEMIKSFRIYHIGVKSFFELITHLVGLVLVYATYRNMVLQLYFFCI